MNDVFPYLKHEMQEQEEIGIRYRSLEFNRLNQLEYDGSSKKMFVPVFNETSMTKITQVCQIIVFYSGILDGVT